jgi:uncharacterized protein with PIN domain
MLGSLATYCRMCGYDTAYALDRGIEADDRLLALAHEEERTLLTRDQQLAERARALRTDDGGNAESGSDGSGSDTSGIGVSSLLLESRAVTGQLRELRAAGYDLSLTARPTRCGQCNGSLEAVVDEETTPEYAPEPDVEAVWRCIECGQCFWKGSHWDAVGRTLANL